MIEIGTLDRITPIIGERGTGKSTLAKIDALEFQRSTGGLVLGHSPNGQIGHESYIDFHDSFRSLEKGLRKRPGQMHFLADGGSPEEVIDYARALSLALRRKGHESADVKFNPKRPAPPSVMAAPVLVIIDEGTHTDQSKRLRKEQDSEITTADLRELEKFLTSARHENVALTFLIQAPTARSWVYMEQGNRFRVFRYMHEWGLNSVRAAAIPKEAMAQIRKLPKFCYYHFDKDNPERAGFRKLPPL